MSSRRLKRVGALLKNEIGNIIQEGLTGTHEGLVSVTEVKVAADLKSAKVFVSIFAEEDETEESFKLLINSRTVFRRELSRRIRLRHIPELTFYRDASLYEGSRITELLEKIEQERKNEPGTGNN